MVHALYVRFVLYFKELLSMNIETQSIWVCICSYPPYMQGTRKSHWSIVDWL